MPLGSALPVAGSSVSALRVRAMVQCSITPGDHWTKIGPKKLENWRPLGDSNPCYRRERAVSWASRRRGRERRGPYLTACIPAIKGYGGGRGVYLSAPRLFRGTPRK